MPELVATAPAIAARFGSLVTGLIALIARAFYRHPTRFVIILPLCLWFERTVRRFSHVMHKLEAGTLRPRRPGSGRPSSGKRPLAIPRNHAWLLVDLKHEGAYFAHRLEALLAEPGTATLIAATPQAQRLLRPICHILGIKPTCLKKRRLPSPPLPASRRSIASGGSAAISPSRVSGLELQGRPSPGGGSGGGESPSPVPNAITLGPSGRARHEKTFPRSKCGCPGASWEGPAAESSGLSPSRDPYANLCPRLRTRWPFNQLPRFRQA
jgi:hypothetical protein